MAIFRPFFQAPDPRGRLPGMRRGTVSWFNDSKGLGSIKAEGGPEVHVHYSAIRDDEIRTLAQGDVVRFELRETVHGLQAANVVRN
jgi:cold shock protein